MPVRLRCPSCHRALVVPNGSSGKTAKCKLCGQVLKIPRVMGGTEEMGEPAAPKQDGAPGTTAADSVADVAGNGSRSVPRSGWRCWPWITVSVVAAAAMLVAGWMAFVAIRRARRPLGLKMLADPRIFRAEDVGDLIRALKLYHALGKHPELNMQPTICDGPLDDAGRRKFPRALASFEDVRLWYGPPERSFAFKSSLGEHEAHYYPPLYIFVGRDGSVHGLGLPASLTQSAVVRRIMKELRRTCLSR